MSKTWLVLKHEVWLILRSKGFWFFALGIPLIATLIYAGVNELNKRGTDWNALANAFNPQASKTQAEGYVDLSGLLQPLPADFPKASFVQYPDEDSVRQALEAGTISAYYIIGQNYLKDGTITYIRPDFNPLSAEGNAYVFEKALDINLLQDAQLADRVAMPLNITSEVRSTGPQRDEKNPMSYWLPYAVTMFFYIMILGSASMLLSSVTKEKENRAIEIAMMSVTPRQLLTGKILGLGIIGLVQMLLWLGTGYGLLNVSGRTFNLDAVFRLPLSFVLWGIAFFIMGYGIYAALMAGLGALVPNLREASQATFVVIMPLIIPMFLMNVLIEEPNGTVATILSFIPFTAPVVMMTRLSSNAVTWWHPWVSIVLVAITVIIIIRAVAGMFRAQTLLSGQAFNVKRFFSALLGKA